MILVDTSVWVRHISGRVEDLTAFLDADEVLIHPSIIGELAMGNLYQRDRWMRDLQKLPRVIVATDHETLRLIDQHRLYGRGIGYIDAHLLASARLTENASLWTFDQRLQAAAIQLKVAHQL